MIARLVSDRAYVKGVVVLVLATFFWSLSGVFVRSLPGLDGWQINAYRGCAAGVTLLLYLLIIYGRGTWQRFRAIELRALVATILFFTMGSTTYVLALTLAPTATVACLTATAPIFTAMLSPLVTGERPGPIVWVAAFLALLGAAVVVGSGIDTTAWVGSLVALGCAFCFAGQTVVLRRFRQVDMVPAICIGGFAVSAMIAPFVGDLAIGWRNAAVIGGMGVLQLALPLVLYAYGAKFVPAVTITLLALLDVVFNPLWSWIGVGERPAATAYFGASLIVLAVAVSVIAGRRMAVAKPALELSPHIPSAAREPCP